MSEKEGIKKIMGWPAIELAEKMVSNGKHDNLISKYADPIEEARHGLTIEEAKDIARDDPGLIYIVVVA